MSELTLEILDECIAQIRQYEKENEFIGFVLNPFDMANIRNGKSVLFSISNNEIKMFPPYCGFELYESNFVPSGYPIPIKRKDRQSLKEVGK